MSADNKDVELLTEHEKKRAIIKRSRRNDGSLCALPTSLPCILPCALSPSLPCIFPHRLPPGMAVCLAQVEVAYVSRNMWHA